MDPELLQTLMQNPEQGRELLHAMVAERAANNPSLAALMQMMSQRQAEADLPAESSTPRRASLDLDERTARIDRVRTRVSEMRDELVRLRERVARFAAAVGACAACWGEDDSCASCGGEGAAGWLDPDPMQFTELVAPAVTRLADTNGDPGDGA
jgi:hypothetical protein